MNLGSTEPLHQLMARAFHPDPGNPLTVVLVAASPGDGMDDPGSQVCRYLVMGGAIGGSCNPLRDFFARGPLNFNLGGSGSSQSAASRDWPATTSPR